MGRGYSYSPSPQGVTAGGVEAQAQGVTTVVVQETFLLASWSATFAMIVRHNLLQYLFPGLKCDCGNCLPVLKEDWPEDLRARFGEFGPLKDVYLPRDYYSGEPRGFGFVQFVDPADAEEAKYQMDGQILLGRELTVLFAEENRKKPSEMRARERISRRRSPLGYSRSPRYARPYSRSPSYARTYSRGHDYYSPSPRVTYSRGHDYYSLSPIETRPSRSISPRDLRYRKRSYSRSPYGSRSRSRSPVRSRSWSGDPCRSPDDYSR